MKISKLAKNKFPLPLLQIPQPPKKLYYLGEIERFLENTELRYLAIVGSRRHTTYGRDVCERLIAGLKGYPIVIVSGFAMGIDTLAHKSAIKHGLPTLVFPGSGLSKEAIYPKTNANFMQEVLASGGCFLSEFEPDFKAEYWSFPMRNRLMAGISRAVLLIEASEKSGTLITARMALDYNREVLAVPGPINSLNSKGTNKMIRLGATPITSSEDILEALGFEVDISKKQKSLFEDAMPKEKEILELLNEPLERDELIRKMHLGTAEANTMLSVMELKGYIKEEKGEIRKSF